MINAMDWQRHWTLFQSATSPSERSWWAGKALQSGSDNENAVELDELRQACQQARPIFLSPRVFGMVWLDEDAHWTEIQNEGWKIEDFITMPDGTLNWQRLTSNEALGSMDRGKGLAERVITSDDDDFLRAAPFLRKVSLFVHRSWLGRMPALRFAELYQHRFTITARPEVV